MIYTGRIEGQFLLQPQMVRILKSIQSSIHIYQLGEHKWKYEHHLTKYFYTGEVINTDECIKPQVE